MEIKTTSNSQNNMSSALIGLASTAIGVGANLIGSGMTNKRMRAAQRRQQQYNLELMDKAQQYNIENFNMENDYNSPLHQRERMKAAGLNPNFVDGLSPVVGQMDSISNGTGAAGQVAPTDLSSIASIGLQARQIENEYKLRKQELDIEQQNATTNARNAATNEFNSVTESQKVGQAGELNTAQIGVYQAQKRGYEIENSRKGEEIQARINNLNQQIQESKSREDYNKSVEAYQKLVNEYYDDQIMADINKAVAEGDYARAKEITERELLPYAKKKMGAEIGELAARAYAERISAVAALKDAETNRIAVDNQKQFNIISYGIQWALAEAQINTQRSLANLFNNQAGLASQQAISALINNYVSGSLAIAGLPQAFQRKAYELLVAETEHVETENKMTKQQAESYLLDRFQQIGRQFNPSNILMQGASHIPFVQSPQTPANTNTMPGFNWY